MNRSMLAISVCVLGLLVTFLAGCGASEESHSTPETQQTDVITRTVTPAGMPDLGGLFDQQGDDDEGGSAIDLSGGVSGIGEVKAEEEANLVFTVSGTVEEVYVEEGEIVQKDQLLAILDVRTFDHRVRQAEAGLIRAQAQKSALFEEPLPIDVQIADAQVRQSQASLALAQAQQAALFDPPREADLSAANAQIRQAEASLARILEPPEEVDVKSAQASLDMARANLEAQRDQLSFNKTQAKLQIEQAVYQLTQAQWQYALSQRYWEHADEDGTDPVQPSTTNPMTGQSKENELSQGAQAQYLSQFEQAKAAMQHAEEVVDQSVLVEEQARKSEITGLMAAEQQVVQAEAALEKVLLPPNENDVRQAQAGVDLAIANRDRLYPDPTDSQQAQAAAGVQQAQAGVDLAAANREKLVNPQPMESQIVQADAGIIEAESALELARLNREYAELQSPFEGVVSRVNIDPGDPSSTTMIGAPDNTAVQVVNIDDMHVDVDISDVDISQVEVGQPAMVYADALPGQVYQGEVSYISPNATIQGNVTTYLVRIVLDSMDGLRPGMSVRVEIETMEG